MAIFGEYDASKLKPQLKMAVKRFSHASNKKSALCKQQSREIAKLLDEHPPKEEIARIKAEALIRDDDTIKAYEILQVVCELLYERIELISHGKTCPHDLVECVSTLIWASAVVDVPELVEVREQFRYKYGKKFEKDAMRNAGGVVNERVACKLSIQPPSADLVQVYLEKIAYEHKVKWKPTVPPPPPITPPPPKPLPDDIEEKDIFVPGGSKKSEGIPTPGGGGGGGRRRSSGGGGDDDEYDDGGGGDRPGSGDESSQRSSDDDIIPEISHKGFGGRGDDHSYDDYLAARFAILQR